MGDESHDAYQAEVKRMQDQYGPTAEIPRSPYPRGAPLGITKGSPTPLTPAAPINDRIREMAIAVAAVADALMKCGQESAQASQRLVEAEARFADLSNELATLMGDLRAQSGLRASRVGGGPR